MIHRQAFFNEFVCNIEKERIKLNYSQKQMADALDVSLSAYKRMLYGDVTKLDPYMIYKLHHITGKYYNEFIPSDFSPSPYFEEYRTLNKAQSLFVKSIIDFEHNFKLLNDLPEEYISVFILTGDMQDGMIYDSSNVKKMKYKSVLSDQIFCGVLVTSNHLHPVYVSGDVLLISNSPIRDGDTGIFVNKESRRAYIRRFRQTVPCELQPINNFGKTFLVDPNDSEDMDKWIKFGKVISKVRISECSLL